MKQRMSVGLPNGLVCYLTSASMLTTAKGLRWEVFNRAALKLQLDHTKVDSYGAGQWRHGDTQAAQANVVSLVLDWVF